MLLMQNSHWYAWFGVKYMEYLDFASQNYYLNLEIVHKKGVWTSKVQILPKFCPGSQIPGSQLFGTLIYLLYVSGGAGSCLLYNNHQMSTSIFAICITVKVISVLFYGFSWLASKRSSVSDAKQEYEDKLQLEHKDNKSISLSKTQ